jgi:hypothetical protein
LNIPTPADPPAAIELAGTLLRAAVRILYENHGDLDFSEYYVRSIAPERMANQLHALRCLESPERRQQVVESVNRLRADVDLPPTSWGKIVCSALGACVSRLRTSCLPLRSIFPLRLPIPLAAASCASLHAR